MERLELTITILLVLLVAVCVYIAASWTLWRRKNRQGGDGLLGQEDHDSAIYRSFSKQVQPDGEGVPKITITPIQPRSDAPSHGSGAMLTDDETEEPASELQEEDLGRLYFALQYDQHRSVLLVRLIRGEDIPMEQDISGTYVGVHLLPISLESDVIEPHDASINVSFRECYEFPLTQSELALQTLDFHICRYDRFSRRAVIGDVFLALAELGAQGIDITREVYLCRNIISSKQAYHRRKRKRLVPVDDGEEHEGQFELKNGTKVSRSTQEDGSDPKELWRIVSAAVRTGKYRGASAVPDTPMYQWESMFSPADPGMEYTLPTSPHKPGGIFYFSGPGPPSEGSAQGAAEGGAVEEVVTKGKRSGSFLFPNKSDEGDETEAGTQPESRVSSGPASPLQISPAPEEYYTLVPITPFMPPSPLKVHKPRDPSVSWYVPETFTARGPDVVQALADSYHDPRIVTTANLRQDKQAAMVEYRRQLPHRNIPPAATAALAPSRGARAKAGMHSRITKRKPGLVRRVSNPLNKGDYKSPSLKRQKSKASAHSTEQDAEPSDEISSSKSKKKSKNKSRKQTKYRVLRSTADEPEDDTSDANRILVASSAPELSSAQTSGVRSEGDMSFEAKDYVAAFVPPLKGSTQSDPSIGNQRLYPSDVTAEESGKRLSVSLTDVKIYPSDSDVSSDFEDFDENM